MPARPLLVLLLLGAVTLSGLAGTTSAAAPGHPADPADPQSPVLLRASEALAGRGEATLALRDLFLARPALDDRGRRNARSLLARPTAGTADPFADGYQVPATRRCAEHVCVHRVRRSIDAAGRGWARTTLRVMERVWTHHVETLGYRRPASDRGRGGDARFDVYLKDLGSRGVYGYCAPERRVPGQPRQASGFCVLDNDFAREQFSRPPRQTLKVTAAHEFFHAVQFAYDFGEDRWLLEQTATWMEEQFADDIDDNRVYLPYGQLSRPASPLDLYEPSGFAQYGNWVFWQYLGEHYGRSVVRRVIERAGTGDGLPDDYSARALARVLRREGGLRRVFAAYAAANTRPGRTYDEGASYPTAPETRRRLGAERDRTRVAVRLDHLTSRTLRLRPDDALAPGRWQVRLKVRGPSPATAPAAFLTRMRTDGRLVRRPIELGPNGNGTAHVPFDARRTRAVTVTVVNASTRYRCDLGTDLACGGETRDPARRFTVKAFLFSPASRG